MSGSTILGIVGSAVILLTLFEMMRRHRLREKYALIWALVAVARHHRGAVPDPALRGLRGRRARGPGQPRSSSARRS